MDNSRGRNQDFRGIKGAGLDNTSTEVDIVIDVVDNTAAIEDRIRTEVAKERGQDWTTWGSKERGTLEV